MFRLLIVALHVRCVSKCAIKLLDPLGRSVELMVVESSASSELPGGTGRNRVEQRSGATWCHEVNMSMSRIQSLATCL